MPFRVTPISSMKNNRFVFYDRTQNMHFPSLGVWMTKELQIGDLSILDKNES